MSTPNPHDVAHALSVRHARILHPATEPTFLAFCACGWQGQPRTTRGDADREGQDHVAEAELEHGDRAVDWLLHLRELQARGLTFTEALYEANRDDEAWPERNLPTLEGFYNPGHGVTK